MQGLRSEGRSGAHSERSRRPPKPWLRALVLSLIHLPVAAGLAAQAPRVPFQRLSIHEGLSQGTVNCILQDATGFLWLGTQDGLNRYDGYGFAVYKHDPTDPASLPASWIEALAESAAGDLWIGTQNGLAYWRRETGAFGRFRPAVRETDGGEAGFFGDPVRALLFDRDGGLWAGTSQSGLARIDPAAGTLERFRHDPDDPGGLPDDRVRALYQDRAGNLWIGTLGGLARFDRGRRSFTVFRHAPDDPASLADDRVFSLVEDSQGELWVGTEGGLSRSRDPAAGFVRYRHDPADPASLADDWVTDLLEDRGGRLWIATDGGLHRWRPGEEGFERFRHDPTDPLSLSSDRLLALFEDRSGLIWVGTQGGGINRWSPATEGFAHYRAEAAGEGGLSSNAVFAFSEDPRGRLWIGTLGGGLDVLDDGRFRNYRHDPADPGSLGDDKVSALLHDRSGTLWVGTFGSGLSRLDRGADVFRHYRSDPETAGTLSDGVVTSLHQDRHGALWVGTQRGGLNRLERDPDGTAGERFRHFRHRPADPASLSDDQVTCFVEDETALWIGTFGGGLDRLELRPGSGGELATFGHFRHDPERPTSLSNDTVYALHRDAAGRLWVGTQVGLNLLVSPDNGRFAHYFERDGLPNNVIWGIESDDDGCLWISTNDGLVRFHPLSGNFKTYTTSHGLQADEFNFGAHFRSSTGELFFGGVNGFNAFHPDHLKANRETPPVVLTSFAVRTRPLDFGRPLFDVESVTLAAEDSFFDVEFAVLDFTTPEENRYRYRLANLDDDWIDLGHRRRLTFTHLDPGSYRLHVQGSNSDGVWNREGASLAIRITPPWWGTWWAYMLYAVAGLSAVGVLVRSHYRRIEREHERIRERERHLNEREQLIRELESKNAELDHFNYTVSHDLKTPLVTIKNFLGMVRHNFAAGKVEHLEADLQRISTAADRMAKLLDDLLEFALVGRQVNPPQWIALRQLVDEARELLAGLLDEHGVELVIAGDLGHVQGDPLRLRAVFYNLLENAIKYLGDQDAPRVEVGVRRDSGQDVFFVADNGMGIAPRYHEKIFGLFERLDATTQGTGVGLALVRRILELHRGRIWVESEGPGKGSTFCFTVGGYEPPV